LSLDKWPFVWYIVVSVKTKKIMNNKQEALFSRHIERLEADITAAQERINERDLSNSGMEATGNRDDAKKIALLREGVIPKYSDLPANDGYENNLPEIEMFEFSDLLQEIDETKAALHDLDLIDYGKELGEEHGRLKAKFEVADAARKAVNKEHGLA